jgi:cytoskeletal protein RodZ
MATLGQRLKEAREKKQATASQAAAATRMKIQTLEALENDDFSRIAAPMYAKGFLKLYAEYLGLDAAPLIREYMELHAPKGVRPPLSVADSSSPGQGAPARNKFKIDASKLKPLIVRWKRPIAFAVGGIALFALAVAGASRCNRRIANPRQVAESPIAEEKAAWPVIREPPEPYIETSVPLSKTP